MQLGASGAACGVSIEHHVTNQCKQFDDQPSAGTTLPSQLTNIHARLKSCSIRQVLYVACRVGKNVFSGGMRLYWLSLCSGMMQHDSPEQKPVNNSRTHSWPHTRPCAMSIGLLKGDSTTREQHSLSLLALRHSHTHTHTHTPSSLLLPSTHMLQSLLRQ